METGAQFLWWIVVLLCIAVGFIGTVFPAIPGTPLIFIGMVIAAWIDNYTLIGIFPLIVGGVLTLLALAADLIATAMGAKRVGASKLAVVGATIGTVVGIFFGPLGILLGPFVGAVIGEYYQRRDLAGAGRAGFGTWVGLLLGAAAKIAIAFMMIGVLITALLI